jgi:hypothetical protein
MLAVLPRELPTQVIFVNTPQELLGLYSRAMLWNADPARRTPASLHQLYSGASDLAVKRIDAHTLELRASSGWGRIPIERVFGALYDLPRAGSELDFESMHVSVRESNPEGRPTRVQFRFPTPLESAERLWFRWQGRAPIPWRPPAIGQEVSFPGQSLLRSLQP